MVKTALQKALSDIHYQMYLRVLSMTPDEVIRRLAQLDGRPFREYPKGVTLQRKPLDPFMPYDPVRNPVDAFELMNRDCVLRDYEPYDCLGVHYGQYAFFNCELHNPIRFFEDDNGFMPAFADYITNTCICLSVLLNKDPEILEFVKAAYELAKAKEQG